MAARCSNESTTDPDARMYRKGLKTGWKLQHMAHAVSENQHGLVVATSVSACSPRAERQAAIAMVRRLKNRVGCGGPFRGWLLLSRLNTTLACVTRFGVQMWVTDTSALLLNSS